MNEIFEHLQKASKEELDFVSDYIGQIKNLKECVMILTGSYSVNSMHQCQIRIRNIDLWIEANKLKFPGLLAFRLEVLKKINEVGLEPWPQSIYADNQYTNRHE